MHDLGRERVDVPDGRHQEHEQRAEVGDGEQSERQCEEQCQRQARMPVEVRGKSPPRRLPGRRLLIRGRSHGRASSRPLPADLRPGVHPVLLRLAGTALPSAVGRRRRPKVDVLPEALVACVEVRAEVLVRRVVARLRVRRRLAEPLRDLRVRLRRDDVVHPEVHAVRVGGLRVDHPGVRPARRPFLRLRHLDGLLVALEDVHLVRPGRADDDVLVRIRLDLLRVVAPPFADVRLQGLQEVDGGVELLLVQLVRVVDPEVGLRCLEVDGGVRDEDRIVVDGDLPLVRVVRVPDHGPAVGRRLDDVGPPREDVPAATVRYAVRLPVLRVVVLVLEPFGDVSEVGDEVRVDRRDVTPLHEPDAGVAGCRDAVVLAGRDVVDHLVRRRAVLPPNLAARLLRELVSP